MSTYNGWTNYATWRINLEVFDGIDIQDFDGVDAGEVDYHYVGQQLQDFAEEIIFSGCHRDERRPSNLMEDYARAFLENVNWKEIAKHLVDDYIAENEEA
jgi:hypothetical protein